MRKRDNLAILVLLAVACAATDMVFAGDQVARQGDDEVRLADAPCTNAATLAIIPQELQSDFHQASGRLQGQTFSGCWERMGGGAHIVWEDGDEGFIPSAALKPVLEI